MEPGLRRLVVVSNRLPAALKKEGDCWKVKAGAGGLVTALAPVLKNRGGVWIGWSGASDPTLDVDGLLSNFSSEAGYDLFTVPLTREEVDGYYFGFSNEIIWPLFHDLQTRCRFAPEYWRMYLEVNFKFAEVVARKTSPDDYVWIHDYHLMHQAFFPEKHGGEADDRFFPAHPVSAAGHFHEASVAVEADSGSYRIRSRGFSDIAGSKEFCRMPATSCSRGSIRRAWCGHQCESGRPEIPSWRISYLHRFQSV